MADSGRTEAAKGRRRPKKKKNNNPTPAQTNGERKGPPKQKGRGKNAAANGEQALTPQEQKILRQMVTDFLHSREPEQQLTDLSKAERTHVHRIAQSMGLKTSSKGPEDQRVLTMTRPQSTMQNYLEGARLLTSTQLLQVLMKTQAQVERFLATLDTRPFPRDKVGNLSRKPSNFGLVGVKMVPPEPHSRSRALVHERQNLPIYEHRSAILGSMQQEQVLIVQGATGSGKSTQLPQYILEWAAESESEVRIVVSQPRRLAAISVSERIAKERGEQPGNTVGFQIRMNSKCSSHTVLSLTTSGCLLRAMTMDGKAFFRQTTHLIIDEVHERDLDTDFLLLATKLELQKNPHLRLVLMSATMDLAALAGYFGRASVLNVEGRSFGVKIFHMEDILRVTGYMTSRMESYLGEITGEEEASDLLVAYNSNRNDLDPDIDNDLIVSLLELLINSGEKGAVIVYLPGYHDMTVLMDRLDADLPHDQIRVLLLHSQVESNEMRKAFHIYPEQLKIILSTNIGQTSITIPDLLYVIDVGRSKMKTYDPATDASQLATTWISQADAQQRAGRAGRLTHGICYRLYDSDRLARMSEYTVPEMMRRTLDEICLLTKMAAPDQKIAKFLSMALDPPQPEAVLQACSRLQLLGVLQESDEKITPLGRIIAELPLSVQLGKCLVYSLYYRCLGAMTIIAAYHSVRDPFVLPTDRGKKMNQQNTRLQFAGNTLSDSLAILKLYEEYITLNRRSVANFCEANAVCRHTMEMFISAVSTLRDSVHRIFHTTVATDRLACAYDRDTNMIRLALTAGLYPKLAFIDREKKFQLVGEGDAFMQVSRNSCLLGKKKLRSLTSDWILYVEKIRTADQRSTLEHTSLVSSLMVALAAGKKARLEKRDSQEGEEWEHSEDSEESDLCLDTWIRLACPTKVGQQLLNVRKLMEREVAELVETRRITSGFEWYGPDLARKLLQADPQSLSLAEDRRLPSSSSEFLNCDNDS